MSKVVKRSIIAVALATSLAGAAYHSSARSGLFNNVVDERSALEDHRESWQAVFPKVIPKRTLLKVFTHYGGFCESGILPRNTQPSTSETITRKTGCRVDRSGRFPFNFVRIVWSCEFDKIGPDSFINADCVRSSGSL